MFRTINPIQSDFQTPFSRLQNKILVTERWWLSEVEAPFTHDKNQIIHKAKPSRQMPKRLRHKSLQQALSFFPIIHSFTNLSIHSLSDLFRFLFVEQPP